METTQTPKNYVVVQSRNGRYVPVVETNGYHKALAAYEEGVKILAEREGNSFVLAVREASDPKMDRGLWAYKQDLFSSQEVARMYGAIRALIRKERGATALTFLKGAVDGANWDRLVEQIRKSLNERGFETTRVDAEDALKARCTIGRCRGGCDRAWFWRKGQGTLDDTRCPNCDGYLYQTSLAYKRAFSLIAEPGRKEVLV